MNKWISSGCLAVVLGLSLTLGCGPSDPGDAPGGGGLCESDAECPQTERCDAAAGLCVLRPLALTGESLKAFAGRPFHYPLTASGGQAPYSWSARTVASELGWVTLDAHGVLSGIPDVVAPQAAIDVVVKDAAGNTLDATFAIEVVPCTGDCVGECTPGAVCRGAQSNCDVAEVCTDQGSCPPDEVMPGSTVCRASAGACDVEEVCDGTSPFCPEDTLVAAGTECRGTAGLCDVPESCNGTSPLCPTDSFAAEGTLCRDAAGICDQAEVCTGSAAACPEDQKQPQGTPCRDAAPVCDVAEACDGVSDTCPSDVFAPSQTQCGARSCSNGVATPASTCAGTAAACQSTTPVSCNGYACGGDACRTTCTQSSHCMSTHYCAPNNQCLPKKVNGLGCSGTQAGHECQSGICSARYWDADGDGYGGVNASVTYVCGTVIPPNHAVNNTDCCDTDSRAHPGQTGQFTTPRTGCGGYDFNCDGQQTTTMNAISDCKTQTVNGKPACPGVNSFYGWQTVAPNCGQPGSFVINCTTQAAGGGHQCVPALATYTQTCR